MAIRLLEESASPITDISASVCIVGAGIAGLVAAAKLAKKKTLRVVVIESGLAQFDRSVDALNVVDNPANNYEGATSLRFRGLGGTSRLWAGKLLPLTPQDTRPRPYLNLEGWPLELTELEKYREEIERFMGVDHDSYEEDASGRLDPMSLLARGDDEMVLRWPKRPTMANHNLAHVFRHEIATADNIEIWLGATVSHFECDAACGRVLSLRATNHSGKVVKVSASEFLIAAGTLESTRLLLLADRQSNHALSRDGDSLGRHFNDHLGLNVARLRPLDSTRTNRALSDRTPFSTLRHLHFEMRPKLQQELGIGSAYFDIGVELPNSSALTRLKAMIQSAKSRALGAAFQDLVAVVADSPSLLWTAQWQLMRKQKYWPPNADIQIKIWTEQLPHSQNRVSLSDQLDDLGQPRLKLKWTRTDAEEKTFRLMAKKIDGYWRRHFAGICGLDWNPALSNPDVRLADLAHDLAHPAGSTRMGTSPATSVVDPKLTVHQMPNLSVASASVFPTSGSANPTLTIMQLALRAAEAITKRLHSS